jgi:hypothetical protein
MQKTVYFLLFLAFSKVIFAQNTLVSNANIFEGEPSIALNPQNPQHLIAAWMGFQFGQKIVIKSAYSTNGGTSWSVPIFQAHLAAGNSSADVSLGFDHLGNAFMCYIDYDNVGFTQGKVVVRKSTDGGQSWGNAVEVINITDCPNKLCIDRPWMVVDQSGNAPLAPIYVTTMNADQPALITPPYNPYVSVSIDGGQTFMNPRYLDTLNFLAGSSIPQPMPTPAIDGNGRFYALYPSYLVAQSPYPRQILAFSDHNGIDLSHQVAYQGLNVGVSNSQFKRAGKLLADEAHAGHLAYCFLSEQNDQSDVYVMETTDAGLTWGTMQRVNQDPIGNNRVQDLVWADFNLSGDLVVTWRDRRNAPADGYSQPSEIYAAVKFYGNPAFTADYPISSTVAAHDSVLEGSGNDFMSVVFYGDTCYAVWGDVRTGTLKIYLNKWNVHTQSGSVHEIPSASNIFLYPNPVGDVMQLTYENPEATKVEVFNELGELVISGKLSIMATFDVSNLPKGSYLLRCSSAGSDQVLRFTKAH